MQNRTRFILVGGFLGAGKTTALARLAAHYSSAGKRVVLVTNDQATDLVDTHALRAQGFTVGEVPGACFCCNFDDLIATVDALSQSQQPDIIISEPVGSCTDLMATVVQPLRKLHGDRYDVAPLTVLVKPEHGRKILGGKRKAGFSPKAAYIFEKQIEEADLVAINKLDKLSDTERDELLDMVQQRFPDKQVMAVSARDGDGFPQLIELIGTNCDRPAEFMHVDYNWYAEGEAELGWLNGRVDITSQTGTRFALDDLVSRTVAALADRLDAADAEIAHIKVLGQCDQDVAIANCVGRGLPTETSRVSNARVTHAQLIVNARVATAPAQLETTVRQTLSDVAEALQLDLAVEQIQSFRPGRPVPTYRLQTPF